MKIFPSEFSWHLIYRSLIFLALSTAMSFCKSDEQKPVPSITSFTPASGFAGDNITISGTNFSETPSSLTVQFNGTTAAVSSSSKNEIMVTVPANATSGKISVSLNGKTASSSVDFTVLQMPAITSFSPVSGPVGASVTITGTNFSTTPSDQVVKFNGTAATVTNATSTSLTVTVPADATTGKITVSLRGKTAASANDFTVTLPGPTITSFTPASGTVGTSVTITGTNFKTTPGNNVVKFNGTVASVTAASATSLTATVPAGAATGKITVGANGNTATSSSDFTVYAISSFSPTSGPIGTSVTITGSFDKNYGIDIQFNGTKGTPLVANNTTLVVNVPNGATSGKITVNFNGQSLTSADNFTVTPAITSFSPAAGEVGSAVTIIGTNFSTTPSDNIVQFNGTTATVTAATATSLSVTVPTGATDGYITIGLAGQTGSSSSANKFTVTLPVHTISSFSPGFGPIGSIINISGNNFDNRYAIWVKFNGTQATLLTATLTSLSVYVPSGATSGKITVEINGQAVSSSNDFYVTPHISSFSPTSGAVGTLVTISGDGFSPNIAGNFVEFNGAFAVVESASSTSLTVRVPPTATTGKIQVTVGGYTSQSSLPDFKVIP